MTAMYSNPASSAVRATFASSLPSASGPRGGEKSGICSPTFMMITSRCHPLTAARNGLTKNGQAPRTGYQHEGAYHGASDGRTPWHDHSHGPDHRGRRPGGLGGRLGGVGPRP